MQRARTRILAAFARGAERLGGFGGRSDILAQSMTYDGRADGFLARLERVATATADEVRAASRTWLGAPHYTLTVTPAPTLQPGQTAIDRTILPPLGEPPEVAFPQVQRARLANGVNVIVLERHGAPLVNVSLAVDAGFAADSPEKAGAASLALDLLDDGTTTKDTFRIVDELDGLGAQITTGSSLDLSFVRLRALSRNIRPSLDVCADVVLNPSFPQDMVELAKKRRLAQIGQEKANPVPAAMRIVPQLLYGPTHGYGTPLTGSGYERTVSSLTRDDLAAWHRTWFQPGAATLIVTGGFCRSSSAHSVAGAPGPRPPSGSSPSRPRPPDVSISWTSLARRSR
jgi:zinc protease